MKMPVKTANNRKADIIVNCKDNLSLIFIKKFIRSFGLQYIAHTDYSMDKNWAEPLVNFCSQVINININKISAPVVVNAPYGFSYKSPGQHPVFIDNHKFQQGEFFGCQRDLFSGSFCCSSIGVNFQVCDPVDCARRYEVSPPGDCFDPCHQFLKMKWLYQVIICTGFQTRNFIFCRTESRQH